MRGFVPESFLERASRMKRLHSSVETRLFCKNEPVAFSDVDGYFGELDVTAVGKKYTLRMCIPTAATWHSVLNVQGKNRAIIPYAATRNGERSLVYSRNVSIQRGTNGNAAYLDQRNSHFTVLELLSDGVFQMWNVGIITQRGMLFVVQHPTYSGQCYKNGRQVALPSLQRPWPALSGYMEEFLGDAGVSVLPHLGDYQLTDVPLVHIESDHAKVVWFDPFIGYGVADLGDGRQARVHYSNVTPPNDSCVVCLQAGERLRYRNIVDSGKEGPLSLELKGVTVC